MKTTAVPAAVLALLTLGIHDSSAAEVNVLAATAMKGVLTELAPQFEKATGHKAAMTFGAVGALKRDIDAGRKFDVVIMTKPLIDDLAKAGKVAPSSTASVARAGFGIIGPANVAKPDISSVEGFRRVMLESQSFSYSKDGATANYVERLFERLGIVPQMKPKLQPVELATKAVSSGASQYGLVVVSALGPPSGFQLIGQLPAELQSYVEFSAGISVTAADPAAGKALIDLLRAPASVAVLKSKSMEPPDSP